MSDTVINKTESRATALTQVLGKAIMYRPLTGEFLVVKGGERILITGAERRTFAFLRATGLIMSPASDEKEVPMRTTKAGDKVANQWGLTSQ